MKKLATAITAALISLTAPAAISQTTVPAVNVGAIQASCLISASACTTAVNSAIVGLRNAGVTQAQINSAIAAISGAVVSAAESNPAGLGSYSNVVSALASVSTDARQTAGLSRIAGAMSTGSVADTRTAVAAVASPN